MAGEFTLGSIVSKLELRKEQWNKAIKSAEKDTKSLTGFVSRNSDAIKKMGKAMTIAGGLIVGSLGFMVKQASDSQETFAKFGTVFEDVFEKANLAAENLAKNYGLSTLASKTLLSSTGDLLTGLGLTGEAALGLSERTQQLAVDLASFTNFSGGAKGASDALTKAMLGERESVKALGIVITEEMVKEQLWIEGKEKLTGQAKLQAKAEATLTIALGQSKNAIGDYARTSDSLANKTRELKARLEDVSVSIGTALIPVVTKVVGKITTIVEKVSNWIKENPILTKTIVKITAGVGVLLLVLGPLLIILPGLVTALGAMGLTGATAGIGLTSTATGATLAAIGIKALTFALKALFGPITLIAAAATALIITFQKLQKAKEAAIDAEDRLAIATARLEVKLRKITDAAGLTRAEMIQLKRKYDDNTVALLHAIHTGKEDVKLKKAMVKVGAENVKAMDAQKKGVEAHGSTVKRVSENVVKLIATMKNDIKKATLDEFEFKKQKAEETFEIRKKLLEKEGGVEEDFVLLKEALDAELGKIEKNRTKSVSDETKKRKAFWKGLIKDEKKFIKDRITAERDFQGRIEELTLGEFELKKKQLQRTLEEEIEVLNERLGNTKEFLEKKAQLEGAFAGEFKKIQIEQTVDAKEQLEERLRHWMNFAEDAGSAFSNFATSLLDKNKTLKEKWQQFTLDLKNSFIGMIGDMLKEWATNFVKNFILGAAKAKTAADTTGKVLQSAGKAIGAVGKGIGSVIESLATAIANAARTLAKAAPQLLVVGAVALALFAGFKAIQSLFGGGKGKAQDKATEMLQDIRNKTFDIFNGAQWMWKTITGDQQKRLDDHGQKFNWMVDQNKEMISIQSRSMTLLEKISAFTELIANALKNMPTAATGGFFPQETIVKVAEKAPEAIGTIPQLKNAFGGGGGSGTSETKVVINNQISPTFNTFDPMTMRDVWREHIEPQMLESFSVGGKSNTQLKQILGVT